MPAVDLQMQYGLTVRPVELVEEIEAPLREAAPDEVAPQLGMPPVETRPAGDAAPTMAGARKRRGRRGGRQRRRGGEAVEAVASRRVDRRRAPSPPGPPPGPPGA